MHITSLVCRFPFSKLSCLGSSVGRATACLECMRFQILIVQLALIHVSIPLLQSIIVYNNYIQSYCSKIVIYTVRTFFMIFFFFLMLFAVYM